MQVRVQGVVERGRTRIIWYFALLLTAILWGIAFVPQRVAMSYTGPHTFNALRFGLGGVLVGAFAGPRRLRLIYGSHLRAVLTLGALLFAGAACQQLGMVSATAGEGGFITGLYIVIVPILLAVFWHEHITWNCWAGALVALAGLALLTLTETFSLSAGDLWILACALAFSLHVIAVAKLSDGRDALALAVGQYLVCALLSAATAVFVERDSWGGTVGAASALAYMVVCSIGIAYTLQVLAQRHVPAANAAVVLSLEAVFAALAGWIVLEERLRTVQWLGCMLMFGGMLLAQAHEIRQTRARA